MPRRYPPEVRRVAIARALINQPKLLLADEPTGNLDSHTGEDIIALLLSLRDQHATTILLATQDPHIAARADRLICLQDGRITDDVDLSDLHHGHDAIARMTQHRA